MFYKVESYKVDDEDHYVNNGMYVMPNNIYETYLNQSKIESIVLDSSKCGWDPKGKKFAIVHMSWWRLYCISEESYKKIISSLHIE